MTVFIPQAVWRDEMVLSRPRLFHGWLFLCVQSQVWAWAGNRTSVSFPTTWFFSMSFHKRSPADGGSKTHFLPKALVSECRRPGSLRFPFVYIMENIKWQKRPFYVKPRKNCSQSQCPGDTGFQLIEGLLKVPVTKVLITPHCICLCLWPVKALKSLIRLLLGVC